MNHKDRHIVKQELQQFSQGAILGFFNSYSSQGYACLRVAYIIEMLQAISDHFVALYFSGDTISICERKFGIISYNKI